VPARTCARRTLALCGLTAALAASTTAAAAAGPLDEVLPPVSLRTTDTAHDLMAAHARALTHDRVVRSTMQIARKLAETDGDHVSGTLRARLERRSLAGVRAERGRLEAKLQAERHRVARERERTRTGGAPDVAIPGQLTAIAACESGGDPGAIGGGGAYRGKYQFSYETWAAVGGSGDPAAAPEVEQDRRAAMLYAKAGAGQWPVCGR
jgi:hypothetical protein